MLVADLVGHEIRAAQVDGYNARFTLDNGVVIEPVEFSPADFSDTAALMEYINRCGRKVLCVALADAGTVDVVIGKVYCLDRFKLRVPMYAVGGC